MTLPGRPGATGGRACPSRNDSQDVMPSPSAGSVLMPKASRVRAAGATMKTCTPAGTTRGFGPAEFRQIADLIAETLNGLANTNSGDNAAVEAMA